MGGTELLLVAAVVVIPLAIAVAVTLWTLEPAAQRAERAKRGRKRAQATGHMQASDPQAPSGEQAPADGVDREKPSAGTP